MRGLRSLLLLPVLAGAAGCGDGAAADPEASFATWLAGLPAPRASEAFSGRFALTVDFGLGGARSALRAAGMLALDGRDRARFDCDVEVKAPSMQGAMTPESDAFRAGTVSIFDGETLWVEGRTDSGMLAKLANDTGYDLDAGVATVQRRTIERLLERMQMLLHESAEMGTALEQYGLDGDFDPATLGPAYWVHMVGRKSEVSSFKHGGDTVEVGFRADPALLPELPGVSPELLAESANSISLRMVFDADTGYTRAVRIEFASGNGADSISARFDLAKLSSAAPDPALFVYEQGERQAIPLDALFDAALAQLPEPADTDEDL